MSSKVDRNDPSAKLGTGFDRPLAERFLVTLSAAITAASRTRA
jgi:hypothetical protein